MKALTFGPPRWLPVLLIGLAALNFSVSRFRWILGPLLLMLALSNFLEQSAFTEKSAKVRAWNLRWRTYPWSTVSDIRDHDGTWMHYVKLILHDGRIVKVGHIPRKALPALRELAERGRRSSE